MNTQSIRHRLAAIAGRVALVAVVGVLAGASVAKAQAPRDRGPWERLDLTGEQRDKVREIVKEHREASREELHRKLASVLTEDQLEQLEKMDRGPRGNMWDNRPGRPGRPGRRQHLNWRGPRGDGRGCGDCARDRGGRGGRHGGKGMRRGGGMGRGDMGPGPRMGEMREERGERSERMVERLAVVLDLTDVQKEKIAAIVKEHQGQFEGVDRSEMTFEERQEMRDAHRMLLANRIKEVLSDAQKEKYDAFMETLPGPRHGRREKKN